MQFFGGTYARGESKPVCCGFSRRTTPFSTFIALISPRIGHHEFKQLLFRLPLFKRGSILAEHEKVRGMQSLGRATGWPLVVQLQLVRLIKKLQNLSIILHCVDSPQFNGVAFKLDAHTHFAARVRSADIEETPLNPCPLGRRKKGKEERKRGSRERKTHTAPLKSKG